MDYNVVCCNGNASFCFGRVTIPAYYDVWQVYVLFLRQLYPCDASSNSSILLRKVRPQNKKKMLHTIYRINVYIAFRG